MNHMKSLAVMVAALLVAASALAAQEGSLAEAAERAKRERAARKGKAAPSYGEQDLGRNSGISVPEPAGEAPAAAAAAPAAGPGDKKEKTEEELRAERREAIRKDIAEQQRLKGVVQQAMDEAQVELNDASTALFGSRREKLAKLVEDGQQELKKMDARIAELEEELRRLGPS
jgi:hypothetical protein